VHNNCTGGLNEDKKMNVRGLCVERVSLCCSLFFKAKQQQNKKGGKNMGKKYIVNIYSDPVEEFWNYDELIDESELHVGSGEYDFETETFEFTPEMYEEEWKYIQEDILEAILQHGEGSIRYCNRKLNIVFNIYVEEKYAPPERGKNFWHSHYQNDEDRQDLKLFDEAEEEAYYLLEEKIKEIENERGVSIEYESKVLPEDPDPDADFYVGDYSFVIYHEGEKYEYKGDGVYFASRQNGSCFNASGDYLEYIYTSEEVKESAEEFKARMLQFIDNIHLFNSDLLIKVFDGDKHVATVERKNDKYTVTYNEKFTKLFFYILRDEVEDSLPFNKLNVRGYKVIVSALEEVK